MCLGAIRGGRHRRTIIIVVVQVRTRAIATWMILHLNGCHRVADELAPRHPVCNICNMEVGVQEENGIDNRMDNA